MKFKTCLFIASVGFHSAIASPETRERFAARTDEYYSRLQVIYEQRQPSPQEVRILLRRIEDVWQSLPQEDKQFLANRRWHDYRVAATALADLADYQQAAEALQKQVAFCSKFGMSPTGKSDSHFEKFVLTHARVASAVGHDPLEGTVDYLFRPQNGEYIIARKLPVSEVMGITVDGLTETEVLAQVLQVSAKDGQALIERTRWVVGPQGSIEETLRRATREVSFDEDGRLSAKSLITPVFTAVTAETRGEGPGAVQMPATRTPTPAPIATAIATPVPKTAVVESPVAPVEHKAPVWPWVVVAALALVSSIALALKRRT